MKNPDAYRYSLLYTLEYSPFTTDKFNSQPRLADQLTNID